MPHVMTIALAFRDSQLANEIRQRLTEVDGIQIISWLSQVAEKGPKAVKTMPELIIVEDEPEGGAVGERVRTIKKNFPEASLFVVSADRRPERVVEAMKAGVQEYMATPLDSKRLVEAVEEVRTGLADTGRISRGRVHGFISCKGGQGGTFLAVNTAVAMALRHARDTALFDLGFQTGDTAVLLDQKTEKTIADISHNVHRLDVALLKSAMLRHNSGLEVLAAPARPEEAADIQATHLKVLFELARTIFDDVIVDLPSVHVGDHAVEVFRSCENIFLVTDFSVTGLRDATRLHQLLQDFRVDGDKVHFLANRYTRGDTVSLDEAEKVLGHKFFWVFPNDYARVISSINRGVPLVQLAGHTPLGKSLQAFAEKLVKPQIFVKFRGVRGMFGQVL